MRRSEALAALVLAIVLGLGMVAVMMQGDLGAPRAQVASNTTATAAIVFNTPTSDVTGGQRTPFSPKAIAQPSPTPAGPRLQPGPGEGPEVKDVVLLYNSRRRTSFSTNFCQLATFYGLGCKAHAVDQTRFSRAAVLTEDGKPYRLVALDAVLLDVSGPWLSRKDLAVLNTLREQGSSLLIGKVDERARGDDLSFLTGEAVVGAVLPEDSVKDWKVTGSASEITRELSGQTVLTSQPASPDTYALVVKDPQAITSLIASGNDAGLDYPIFLRWQPASGQGGAVYLDAGEIGQPLDTIALREIYYSASSFSQIIPTMMVLRYVGGEKTWHNNHNYANLTIDAAVLAEPYQELNYTALLELMKRHTFHTTVAFIPASWQRSQPEVIATFLTNPNYFSMVQYGNNGEGYEFYRYEASQGTLGESALLPARPLIDQERAILEGLARMKLHYDLTRIASDPILVFPNGISPEQTLVLLKENNYLATTNAQDVPLDAPRPALTDARPDALFYGMEPAVMRYGNFPNLIRRAPSENQAYRPYLLASILDLFVDKPALFYTFPYGSGLFASGMSAFDPVADEMNRLHGGVEWHSLGYIARRLYLEKTDDDGSRSVRMYARQLIFENETDAEQIVHVSRPETLNVPIASLKVNGYDFPYQVKDGMLKLDLILPARTTVEIDIEYHRPVD